MKKCIYCGGEISDKCIYCGGEISDESVIDFCEKCGKNVWGEKMFNTIVRNMENARENNDLCNSNDFSKSTETLPQFESKLL